MYYLEDTSRHNGCLRLLPGSHRRRLDLHDLGVAHELEINSIENAADPHFLDHEGEVDVPVRAGDLVGGDARMFHAAHSNESGQRRTVITIWFYPLFSRLLEPVQSSDTMWQVALVSMQWIMNRDVHLGGESALALAGLTHYLSLGHASSAHVYGKVPAWLRRLPAETQFVVHSRTWFRDDPTGVIDAGSDAPRDGPDTTLVAHRRDLAMANQGLISGTSDP